MLVANKTLINDPRLTADMSCTRSGSTQLFRRRGLDNKFTSKENADVILESERPELCAELIDGEWYWANNCAECNGKDRGWSIYVECEKHDVCRTCQKPRAKIKGGVWGGKNGWQCNPCNEAECATIKREALEKMNNKDYDESEYYNTDKIVCPHCEHICGSDSGCDSNSEEEICEVCGGRYSLEMEYSASYTTAVIGERFTICQ